MTLTITTIAIQPKKIGTENSRMKRGIIGCAPTWVLLMRRPFARKLRSCADLAGSATALCAHDSLASFAHADFTRQKVWAFTPSVVLSSLTSPSTVMRQVMVAPSLWAMMFGLAAGAVVVRVSDHGNGVFSAFCGCASRSR